MLRRHFINVSYSEDIPRNQIWYKTSNGEKFDYQLLIDTFFSGYDVQQLTLLKKNELINDGWWCLTFTNNITYIGELETENKIGPVFTGILDVYETIRTNALNIIEIKLPSISLIGNGTFSFCTKLESITIPNSVTSIGDYAFTYCYALTSITIPNSVTSIGDGAFTNCNSLTEIVIPNSVTSIRDGVFINCISLTSVTIGNSVTSINDMTFYKCSSLISVTIPNSVTRIGDGAFEDCSLLTSITFNGTMAQWEMIEFSNNWKNRTPITVVHCTDGDVEI